MNRVRIAGVAGSVLALTVIGGFAAASTFQTAPAAVVQVATVEPTMAPTVAPVVVPTTQAPTPVESTVAPAPVVAPTSEAPVATKAPAPAPTQVPQLAGHYYDGTPVVKDASGNVVVLPAKLPEGMSTTPAQTIPTP